MQRPTRFLILLCCSFLFSFKSFAQQNRDSLKGPVQVDKDGIMRWANNQEVKGFGVNYSVPFAHAFRTGKKLGIDLKKAIDRDVYHFSRLGFDLYRIHVWDTEISDEAGNLLENEHLDLFDYLISKLKERNINFVLTPIAYWGNGWPEPDEDTPGFSNKFGKEKSLTDPQAVRAQENYLAQFLNHVNPYTGIAYKEEPNVIGFEVSNEPHHRENPEAVREFIDKMVAAMRATGTKKPIFYNVSHSIHLAETYAHTNIDGGTFQWYPTGLGFGKELEGNLLPNVNDYEIPFNEMWRREGLAKLTYEFDAADMMKSYMYPAMARSFRQAGIQIATHFAYDPTYMAFANTEYNTHYMNLAYTPRKALALMISGEIFHQLPLYSDLGGYPENLDFGDFSISYESDLAQYNAEEVFLYTNSTDSEPVSPTKLRKIAGYGNSKVIRYEGRGAYFLDRLEKGVWRLEVMPDAIVVDNPFGKNSLEKTIAVIAYHPWEMNVDLPDLEENFQIKAINQGNTLKTTASGTTFQIVPGTYLLVKQDRKIKSSFSGWKKEDLTAFVAPQSTVEKTYLLHSPVKEISKSTAMQISAEVISNKNIDRVEAWLQNGNTYERIALMPTTGYTYEAEVPSDLLNRGFLNYQLIVYTEQGPVTFPGAVEGDPGQWDFYHDEQYRTSIVPDEKPIYLFNALNDAEDIVGKWLKGLHLVPTRNPQEAEYQVNVPKLFEQDPENLHAEPVHDYSFRYTFKEKIRGRREAITEKKTLVIKGRSLHHKPVKFQIAFVTDTGTAFGKTIHLEPAVKEYRIELTDLKPVKTVILPRPYPTFLPYYFEHDIQEDFEIRSAESLQFSIGPGMTETEVLEQHGVGIISAWLE